MKYAVIVAIIALGLGPMVPADAGSPPPWSAEAARALSPSTLEQTARAHLDQGTPDPAQAALWLRSAAESGSASAMAHLAYLYQQGIGVERDGEQALRWYARSVEAGELQHTLTLGWAYLRGDTVERDRAQAEAWFTRGIEAGFHPARIALASVLIADAYGGRNPERALEAEVLLERSMPHEPLLASYFLARLYLEGIGHVTQDPARGLHYTRIGAEGGNPRMQGWLGRILANGEGVEPDMVEAVKWASLAAAGGDPQGERLRLELEQNLSPEVVDEGRRRAMAWASRPEHQGSLQPQ